MAPIITPLSRCQQKIIDGDVHKIRCFSPANPQYCMRGGVLTPIDLRVMDTFNSGVGPAVKTTENVSTVGVRTDGVPYKLIGFRPDDKQDGTYQLELTLDRVTINGIDQDLTLHEPDTLLSEKGRTCIDVGACQIYTDRRCGRILTPLDANTQSFEIAYTGHFTGCHLGYVGTAPDGYWGIFADDTGRFLWRFSAPLFVDENYTPLRDADGNSLDQYVSFDFSQNQDGTYTYTKRSAESFDKALFPENYFIDAEIAYGNTADGRIESPHTAVYADAHDAASGISAIDNEIASNYCVTCTYYSGGGYYLLRRSFLFFDTSGLSGTVTAASLFLYYTNSLFGSWYIQKGTQADVLTADDYSAFTGSYYAYLTSFSAGYNELAFNSTGLAGVNLGGSTKICVRHKHDYNNHTPIYNQYAGFYFSDNTGTSKDPYLELTIIPSTYRPKLFWYM